MFNESKYANATDVKDVEKRSLKEVKIIKFI